MRTLIATLCLIAAVPAFAASETELRGQWQMELPSHTTYKGSVLIDAEGRATFDSPLDNGRPAKYRGYIDRNTGVGIKMVFTDGGAVAFVYCAAESGDRLHCYASRASGAKSDTFILTRVGPGPQNLTQELR